MIRFVLLVADTLDWLYEFWPVIGVVLLVAATVGEVAYGIHHNQVVDDAFMAECQADGRKHYECQAMLRGAPAAPVMVPVVVSQ